MFTHSHTQKYFKCPFSVENSIGNTRVGKLIIVFLSIAINVYRYGNFTCFNLVQYFLKFTSLSFAFDLLYFLLLPVRLSSNAWESVTFATHAPPIRTARREQTWERACKSAVIFGHFWWLFCQAGFTGKRKSESAIARPAEQLCGSAAR